MKYKLTDETKVVAGITLHRIECVTAFADVEVGEKGGWIEKESNLSQEDNAWVFGNGCVSGDGRVSGNGRVSDSTYFIAGTISSKATPLKKIKYGDKEYVIAAPDSIEDYTQK